LQPIVSDAYWHVALLAIKSLYVSGRRMVRIEAFHLVQAAGKGVDEHRLAIGQQLGFAGIFLF